MAIRDYSILLVRYIITGIFDYRTGKQRGRFTDMIDQWRRNQEKVYKMIIAGNDIIPGRYPDNIINWNSLGFQLLGEAKDCNEVLELCKKDMPDVALLDIDMPCMNGLYLSRVLKKMSNDISIILISKFGDFEYAKEAIEIGVDNYIVKPFSESELFASLLKVKEKLQKQREGKAEEESFLNFMIERILIGLLENRHSLNEELIRIYQKHTKIDLESVIESCLESIDALKHKTAGNGKKPEIYNRKLSRAKRITELAKYIIDANYNDPELCLEKISKEMYLNSDYVRKVFKRELNMTITDYITEKRMEEARKLLVTRNIKLSKLSDEVGYSDVSYFSKCFKKFYGISPKVYGRISRTPMNLPQSP